MDGGYKNKVDGTLVALATSRPPSGSLATQGGRNACPTRVLLDALSTSCARRRRVDFVIFVVR